MSILSRLACEWAVRAFGLDHVANIPTRALRILEEAVELCQAVGVPQDKVDLCTDTVYKRPSGEPMQEIGGVLLTTNILCAVLSNTEPDGLLEMELARVLARPPEHFAKRNQEKVDGGLDVAQDNSPPKIGTVPGADMEIFHNPATGKYFRALPNGETVEIPPTELDRLRGIA